MKPKNPLLFTLFFFTAIIAGCRREPINTDSIRLTEIQHITGTGDISKTLFEYDGSGRIIRVSSALNNQTPVTIIHVIYAGNEVVLARPMLDHPAATLTDTIRLTMDANNQVLKRIQIRFQEFKSPNNPQRDFFYDTINYEYNGAGFPVRETRGYWDSTWFNSGIEITSTDRITGITNHTLSGENVVSTASVANTSSALYQSGISRFSTRSTETNISFLYSKSYLNKTDFSNAAILNEINIIPGARINKAYANLPDKIIGTIVEKDQTGNVVSTDNYTINTQFTYNFFGFLWTSADPASPTFKSKFIYNK